MDTSKVHIVSLSSVFEDPDGDPLSYSAVSSDPAVAVVSLSGSTLQVTAAEAGVAQITVSASDGKADGTASDSFSLTVSANKAPEVVSPIADQVLSESDDSVSISLAGVFSDPDGDPLSYSAVSSNPAVAVVSLSGSTLQVTAAEAGVAQITVSASDGKADGTASDSFSLTVGRAAVIISKTSIAVEQNPLDSVDFSFLAAYLNRKSTGKIFAKAISGVLKSKDAKRVVERAGNVADDVIDAVDITTQVVDSDGNVIGDSSSFNQQVTDLVNNPDAVTDGPFTKNNFNAVVNRDFRSLLDEGGFLSDLQKNPDSEIGKVTTLGVELSKAIDRWYGDYTIRLSQKPTSTVTVNVAVSDPDSFVVLDPQLVFTPADYGEKTVRVRMARTIDNWVVGGGPSGATLTHTVASEQPAFAKLSPPDVGIKVNFTRTPIIEYLGNQAMKASFAFFEVDEIVSVLKQLETWFGVPVEAIGKALYDAGKAIDKALGDAADVLGNNYGTFKYRYDREGVSGVVDQAKQNAKGNYARIRNSAIGRTIAGISNSVVSAVPVRLSSRSDSSYNLAANLSTDQLLDNVTDYLAGNYHSLSEDSSRFNWQQAFLGRDFSRDFDIAVPLPNLAQASDPSPASSATNPRANARHVSLWGRVDFTSFNNAVDRFDFDGQSLTYLVGADAHLKPSILAGLNLAINTTTSSYTYGNNAMAGEYNINLTTVSPYVRWIVNDTVSIWGSIGYGSGHSDFILNRIGDLDLTSIEGLNQDDARQRTDSDFLSFSAGTRLNLWQSGNTAVAFKLSGSTASFLEVDLQQARLAAETSRNFNLAAGDLDTAMDLAWIVDNDETSVMELTGRFNWQPQQSALSTFGSARVLLFAHDHQEWGIGGGVRFRPSARGEGLSLSLQPSFGITSSFLNNLDTFNTTALHNTTNQPLTARLNAELGYGFRIPDALLTPYTDLSFSHSSNTTTVGLLYAFDSGLDLDLNASRINHHSPASNDTHYFLKLRKDL